MQPENQSTPANIDFWDELCGTQLARELGVTDARTESLAKFDDFYFGFYPYLEEHIPFKDMSGCRVLEVGLGYGTVAERIAKSGAAYTGLDVAKGPVEMVRHRLRQKGLSGNVVQGSVLTCPFNDNQFDHVIAIGCYHHTGNLQRAFDETWRVLRPGGRAVIMVYGAYSYRLWLRWPLNTAWQYLSEILQRDSGPLSGGEEQRAAYDSNIAGSAAPETVFTSTENLRRMTHGWSNSSAKKENIGLARLYPVIPRRVLLATLGRLAGLDIYIFLQK